MSAITERMTGKRIEPWIGVDFDGTLAISHGGRHSPTRLGEPIKPMMARVRRWLKAGKKVKIFTARASDDKSVTAIRKWLQKHDLPSLEVTNVKDHAMTELWDDKAVGVKKNTGIAEAVVDKILNRSYTAKDHDNWFEAWLSPTGQYVRTPEGHIKYATTHVLGPNEWRTDEHGQHLGVYAAMKRRGWLRVIRKGTNLIVDLYQATDAQRAELEAVAREDGYTVVDERAK